MHRRTSKERRSGRLAHRERWKQKSCISLVRDDSVLSLFLSTMSLITKLYDGLCSGIVPDFEQPEVATLKRGLSRVLFKYVLSHQVRP